MEFNICVAVPIQSGNFQQNETVIKSILKEDPNFIEFRFDYIDSTKKITKEFGEKLLNLVQPNIPAIFTFRDYSEGGQININDKDRLKILKTLLEAQPEYLDIEMNSTKLILEEIIFLAVQNNVNLIFSYHDFKETPTYEEGFAIIDSFMNKLTSKLIVDSKIIRQSIYKAIFTANKFEDNLISLDLCKSFSKEGHKIISFCMGDPGILSRLICLKVGSFLTYGSFEDKTAPGQINIRKMRKFYEILF
ncbi:MAG: type I 3-dehydroquinate dehydratase [Promethearchaeota archaeon]